MTVWPRVHPRIDDAAQIGVVDQDVVALVDHEGRLPFGDRAEQRGPADLHAVQRPANQEGDDRRAAWSCRDPFRPSAPARSGCGWQTARTRAATNRPPTTLRRWPATRSGPRIGGCIRTARGIGSCLRRPRPTAHLPMVIKHLHLVDLLLRARSATKRSRSLTLMPSLTAARLRRLA